MQFFRSGVILTVDKQLCGLNPSSSLVEATTIVSVGPVHELMDQCTALRSVGEPSVYEDDVCGFVVVAPCVVEEMFVAFDSNIDSALIDGHAHRPIVKMGVERNQTSHAGSLPSWSI